MKAFLLVAIAAGALLLLARMRRGGGTDTRLPGRETVDLALEPLTVQSGRRRFRLVYAEGGVARSSFIFEYASAVVPTGQPAAFVRGVLEHDSDVPPERLLAAIAEVHGADQLRDVVQHTDMMEVDVALFGEALSLGAGSNRVAGFFTTDVAGHWTAAKLFLPVSPATGESATDEGSDEEAEDEQSEVFLALNPSERRAILYAKDPDYAVGVLRAFGGLLAKAP